MPHSKDRPILEPLEPPAENLPRILNIAREELSGYYWFPDELLSHLNHINGPRKTRSERRAKQIIVARTLLQYVDLSTLRIGIPTPKGFIIFKNAFLIKKSGLKERSFKASLADLIKAGYVSSTKYANKSGITGEFRGYSIRVIRQDFFFALGISAKDLEFARMVATGRVRSAALRNNQRLNQWNELPQL